MKKALSVFLSLIMILTMSAGLNITARAEESVKSSFDEATGTLTFSGNGTVSAQSYDFTNIGDKIIKVIAQTGIDAIDKYAFSKATSLQSVIVYNPVCQISADGILPIEKNDVTFYGFDKSTAQDWAEKRNFEFKHIYTITFLKYDKKTVSKIIYALEDETADELAKQAPEFSKPYPYDKADNAHCAVVAWNPALANVSKDKQYIEKTKVEMCDSFAVQKVTKAATCVDSGVLSTVCEKCGRTLEMQEIPKTDNHTFVDNEEFCTVCHIAKNPNYTTTTTTTTTTEKPTASTASPTDNTTTAPTAPATTATQPNVTAPTTTKASKPTSNAKKVGNDWVDSKIKKASISKLGKGKKSITISWKKVSTIKGYQIQLATDENFKKNKKTVNISKQKTTKSTVKKLKGKKKYYVRIRTYKNVKYQGKTIKVYSSWSKVKTIKTK